MHHSRMYDVIIVGGGPAGLSAALVLGRSLRQVIVIDEGKPRNRVTAASHGFLTRDGIAPQQLRAKALQELRTYPNVQIVHDTVQAVQLQEQRFIARTANEQYYISKRMIFATGVRDQLPAIPGLADVYGRSIFPCPYCDGWERRHEPLAVIGSGEHLFSFIRTIAHWSRDLIVFTNGAASMQADQRNAVQRRGIPIIETPVVQLRSKRGRLEYIELEDGVMYKRAGGFIVHTNPQRATDIPAQLGIPVQNNGTYTTTSEHGHTALNNLYIIGDAKNSFTGLMGAAYEGYYIGESINNEMIEAAWESE